MKKLLLSSGALVLSLSLKAQSVDLTFGNNGTVTHLNQGRYFDSTLLPDGKVILSGNYQSGAVSSAVILKLNTDGSLDQSFATGGVLTVDNYSSYDYFESFSKVEVLNNGKLFVAYGAEFDNGLDPETISINLMRFNADGTPDATFTNPWSLVGADYEDAPYGFKLLPSGKYLAFGDNFLMRFNANGSLDTSYGNNGKRTINFFINDLFVNSSNVYLTGYNANSFNNRTLYKLIDESAGISNSYNYGSGTIYQNGSSFFEFDQFEVTKLTSSLTIDTSFGVAGKITTSNQYISDMLFQSGGSIILYNNQYNNSGTDHKFTRFNADGSLNTAFGQGGIFTLAIPNSLNYSGNADNLIHPNGNLYTMFYDNNVENFYLKRIILPNETLAVKENGKSNDKIFILENPVGNTLRLSADVENADVYEASGKLMLKNLKGREHPVSSLSKGIYFINEKSSRGEALKLKFIKK